jgi:hypothetical protein
MDMDQAAVFLAGSVLTALGFLIWICCILLINNLVAKYWKSWGWHIMGWFPHNEPTRFMSQEEAERLVKEEEHANTKRTND